MTISSPHNDHLKALRKLARRRAREQTGRFVAEGEDLLAAADAAGWPALERYCAAGSGLPGVELAPELLASVSQLGSGTRALAVYEQRWAGAPAGPLCVALYGIADPGNVGAVLRSALAFGASSVALGPGCADPYGPKAVRASMGAVFAVPLVRLAALDGGPGSEWSGSDGGGEPGSDGSGSGEDGGTGIEGSTSGGDGAALVAALPGTTVALDARAEQPLAEVVAGIDGPLTLLVGAERAGLPAHVIAACDRVARIPIHSESLNAAMAASVALYEVTREASGSPAADRRMPSA